MALTLKTDFVNDPNLDSALSPTYTVTRATTKTFTDWEGVLRTAPDNTYAVEGARRVRNLMTHSQDLSQSPWTLQGNGAYTLDSTTAPDGTTTADTLRESGSSGSGTARIYWSSSPVEQFRTYTYSAHVKKANRTWGCIAGGAFTAMTSPQVFFDLDNGVIGTTTGVIGSGIEELGDGWYRVYLTWTHTVSDVTGNLQIWIAEADNNLTIADLSTDPEMYYWGMQLEDVSGQADQSPSEYQATTTAAAHKWYATKKNGDALDTPITGVSVEEARTNLALYSQDTSNAAWVASNVTKGSTSVATPTGATSTTVRLTSSAANGTLLQTVTAGASQYAYSVYMKRVTGTGNIDLTVDNGTTWTTKTLTSSWQRFDVYDASETNPVIGVRIVTSGDAIDFWGSQLEAAAFPSTYTGVTTSSSVTRNADIIRTDDVSAITVGQGTDYIKCMVKALESNDSAYCYGSGADYQQQLFTNLNGRAYCLMKENAVNQVFTWPSPQAVVANTPFQWVCAYDTNDVVIYQDGGGEVTDTSATPPTSIVEMNLGSNTADGGQLNGWIQEFRYYDTRLTNAEAQAMSNGTFPFDGAWNKVGVGLGISLGF